MSEALKRLSNSNNSYIQELKQLEYLNAKLNNIEDKQGIIGNIWNGFKELTTLGQSNSDCKDMVTRFKKGEISFEEAIDYIEDFDKKQSNMTGLITNIATGAASIATATAVAGSGPIGWALAFAKGGPLGAMLKAGIGIADRMTNKVENDALNFKQVSKDAISGAITGAVSAVSSASSFGFNILKNKGVVSAESLAGNILKGAACGVECGALSGASSYLTNVAFGDEDFDLSELTSSTMTSAFVSGTVGGVVGSGLYGLQGTSFSNLAKTTRDTISSSVRKMLGQSEKDMLDIA